MNFFLAMDYQKILEVAFGSGLGVALLVFAIRWLDRDRNKILGALEAERTKRVAALEESSAQCAEDRIHLHSQMANLQIEVRKLYADIASMAKTGHCDAGCLRKPDRPG